MSAGMSGPKERKQRADVDIVRESWARLQPEIGASGAMTSFLNDTLDRGGADICLAAFKLVHRVLHPQGYVRRVHKSENQNMKAMVENEDGPWMQQRQPMHMWYDMMDSWQQRNKDVLAKNALSAETDKSTGKVIQGASARPRPAWRKYEALTTDDVFGQLCNVDGRGNVRPLRTGDFSFAYQALRQLGNGQQRRFVNQGAITNFNMNSHGVRKLGLKTERIETATHPCDIRITQYPTINVRRWQRYRCSNANDLYDSIVTRAAPVLGISANLQPYWTLKVQYMDAGIAGPKNRKQRADANIENELKNIKKITGENDPQYKNRVNAQIVAFQNNRRYAGQAGKPDVSMEVVYHDARTGLQKKRIVVAEIDGEDKTMKNTSKHAVKLAQKMFLSCSMQQVLQPDTYNIRSNFDKYVTRTIQESLMDSTNVNMLTFQEILERLQKQATHSDHEVLLKAIHLLHHMFTAHVQVAF